MGKKSLWTTLHCHQNQMVGTTRWPTWLSIGITSQKPTTILQADFVCKSGQGNEYILVRYHYNTNCILGQSVENKTATAFMEAWKILHSKWSKAGVEIDVLLLDSEKAKTLIDGFDKTTLNIN